MRKIFHEIVSLERAREIVERSFQPRPLGSEVVSVEDAVGRVLAEDVVAQIDVPPFDRSVVDGFAVRAEDTFGAYEDRPVKLVVVGRVEAGGEPSAEVSAGRSVEVATGAPLPRGANAVVMVEHTKSSGNEVTVFKSVPPGDNVMSAGSDIMVGEKALARGKLITPREVGVLAALGRDKVRVYSKPKVAVLSTGGELAEPGKPLPPYRVFDVNSSTVASAAKEDGCEVAFRARLPDDDGVIRDAILKALEVSDVVLISGGTSAGAGDVVYKVLGELGEVLVHGLAVRPGKPTVVARCKGKLVVGLPGNPVSALMVYSTLASPVLRAMGGLPRRSGNLVMARMAMRIASGKGRREFLPVSLVVREDGGLSAYPLTGGSGAITTLSLADGYVEVPEDVEFLDEGELVEVHLFSDIIEPADLVVIGSHCIGLEKIVELLAERGVRNVKAVNVGSLGGIYAVKRGEADVAGIHLFDEKTGEYNEPFVKYYDLEGVVLLRGYLREQGFIVAKGNPKRILRWEDLLRQDVFFVNRNRGSGTRALIDTNLREVARKMGADFDEVSRKIRGYSFEAKTHSAVAAAVAQGRADVGVGIKSAAKFYGLDFIPLAVEKYDFLVRKSRARKAAVEKFIEVLRSKEFRRAMEGEDLGFKLEKPGEVVLEA